MPSQHARPNSSPSPVFWPGFRRKMIPYERLREHGSSGWTFRRKVRYMFDSSFAFTELPIAALFSISGIGFVIAVALGIWVLIGRLAGNISVPGYTPIILMLAFSLSIILFALGIIGSYVWRTFDNTKGRPLHVPMSTEHFGPSTMNQPVTPRDDPLETPIGSTLTNSGSQTLPGSGENGR